MSEPTSSHSVQHRRHVTVLFLDVVGSTELTGRLDPEDVSEVMDGALECFSTVVQSHGGRVLQYAGDSLLAAFGAVSSREDDAERAVHAGLALLAAAKEHAAVVRRKHGFAGFDVRVGLHTGHVLLGGGVDADGTIRGLTVNIAARMEQSAPPGTVRISHETWRQVRGVLEAQVQPPLQVKGHEESLVTYLVARARPRAQRAPDRGIEGIETGLVGREAEFARLLDAWQRSVAGGGLQVATVLAEAGLGKSRLLHEFERRLEAADVRPVRILHGRSLPGGQQQAYGLLRDLLARELQIADSDSAESARTRLVDGLRPHFEGDGDEAALRQAELLGQLVGMDFSASPRLAASLRDARMLRDGALAAFAAWLRHVAASGEAPVVLALDDLQWADDASLDMLEQLRGRTELPLFLVLAARPALRERRPEWGVGWQRHESIVLAPLDPAGRRVLMRTLLQRLDDVPVELGALVENQAEGNPYYAEELVQMLIDVGVIDTTGERWRVHPEHLAAARVPGTLVGVLQARLDALAAEERRAIQSASIVGPVFWDDAVRTLDRAAPAALPALQRKAMVEARPESAFDGTEEKRFHHHLLHQVTYDTLLKNERRAGHAGVAGWLAERVGERMAEYLALTAEHYERAGDAARAIDWLERAAFAAQDRYANAMALATFSRVLALPELDDPRRRFNLLARQAQVADLVGDRELQAAALARQAEITEALDDDALRADNLVNRALLADRLGHVQEAQALAERSARLAERHGVAKIAALAYGELGWLQQQRHEFAAAEMTIHNGLRWARVAAAEAIQPRDDGIEAMLLNMLAIGLMGVHDYEGALTALQQALAIAEARHHTRTAVGCHEWTSIVARRLGDLQLARKHALAMAETARQVGLTVLIAAVPGKLAAIAFDEGRYAEAAELALECGEGMARLQSHQVAGDEFSLAADACTMNGELARARALREQAIESFRQVELVHEMRDGRILVADTWRAEGDLPRALALLEVEMAAPEPGAAIDDADSIGMSARMAAWRILAAVNDPRAARQLELAWAELQRSVSRVRDPAVKERMLAASPLRREIAAAWVVRAA